ALVGGHAAGGGVGLADVAFVFEARHLDANRSRRVGHAVLIDDALRADRNGALDVLFDDQVQQVGATLIKHRSSDLSISTLDVRVLMPSKSSTRYGFLSR